MHRKHDFLFSSRSAFTLIELLVVIAIIAILAVVVVLTLNPAQLLAQSRDANRVSDMATLQSAMGLYQVDQGGTGTMGTSSIIYVSLSDASSTCSHQNLLSLPSPYIYNCTVGTSTKNTNTTGWIPVNFQNISAGAPLGALPIDPTNASLSRLYYTYTTNGSQYELTASVESQKYKLGGSNDVISSDGGLLASLYEKGTKLGLEPMDYGDNSLVGYWPLNEGSGNVSGTSQTGDWSGNNSTGIWHGAATGTNGYYSSGQVGPWAGTFDGITDYVSFSSPLNGIVNAAGPLTIAAWVNLPTCANNFPMIVSFSFNLELRMNTSTCKPELSGAVSPSAISINSWHHLVGVVSGGTNYIYVDGVQKASGTSSGAISSFSIGNRVGGGYYFSGLIDDVRIYNRALSAAEIQAMYNAEK